MALWRSRITLPALLVSGFLLPAAALRAQPVRITQSIDDAATVELTGNVSPNAQAQFDQGPAASSFSLQFVTLLLRPSAPQQAALTQLLADQQNPSLPGYHQWLTPESYADNFGLNSADIAKIVSWLRAEGFSIAYEARSRNWIAFNGDAAQIERTFHTQIHRYMVNGEEHFANAGNPSVPAALAGIVGGIRGLHDFRAQPAHTAKSSVHLEGAHPDYTVSSNHYLAPADIATIYDLNRLYSIPINGAGQTIVVTGQADIDTSDIATFRTAFGLPSQAFQDGLPCPSGALCTVSVPNVGDPGSPSDPLTEADLDLEWAGAVAPNATIIYVNSKDAVLESVPYAVSNNLGPIISVSFAGCEAGNTESLDSFRATVQEANSYGMTLVFASGDTGAAGCDSKTATIAVDGLAVNYPASIPEVTAVGGTEFYENGGTYWNSANGATLGSVITYIPEVAWNDTQFGYGLSQDINAGGGGLSAYYPVPSWQTGYPFAAAGFRGVPDVAMSASGAHDPYLLCTNHDCVNGSYGTEGGTSAATPVVAGILALLNQYLVSNNIQAQPGLGNVNPTLYWMSQNAPSAFKNMASPYRSNIVPCQTGKPNCYSGSFGYDAGPGYNLVTGLGSVDAYNLVTSWPWPARPQINSISPPAPSVNAQNQAIVVNGSGFQSNLTVTVTFPNNGGSTILRGAALIQSVTPTSFVMMIGLNLLGNWAIQVNNPDGLASNLFSFTVSPVIGGGAFPDLVVTSLTGPATANPGGALYMSSVVKNQGGGSAGPFRLEFYFSPTANFSLTTAIDTRWGCNIGTLAANQSEGCSGAVALPPSLAPGPWYLAVLADSNNAVVETNENNNWRIADTGPLNVGAVLEVLGAGSDGNLYSIAPQSGATTLLGRMPTVMSDLATYNGVLYAISYQPFGGSSVLYTINPNNGSGSAIGSAGPTLNALCFNQTGTLYAAGSDSLYTINTATGQATLVGSGTGAGVYNSSGDLMFDFSGNLYLTSVGASDDQLFALDPSSGQGTLIGDIGFSSVYGMVYYNDTVYGFTSGGQVITINPSTGAGASVAGYTPGFNGTTVFAPAINANCSYSVSPLSVDVDSTSQAGPILNVTASPGCVWNASGGGFVSIASGATGTGNGTVTYTVTANSSGVDRIGTVTVAGHAVTVTQRATAEIFADVIALDYYFDFANLMYESGITSGCSTSPPDYCPNSTTTRAEMAVFLIVAIEGGNSFTYTPTPYFTDVPPTSPYFKFIQKLRDLGITSGCTATTYCPNDSVTRAEMAVFIIVSRYETTPYTYPQTPYFTDVPATNLFFPFIQKMAQDGITSGCGAGLFCPNQSLTRGQMAVFIVTGLLNELLPTGTAVLAAAAPNSASPGQTLTVTLTGVNTHFVQGATQVVPPAGVTASNISVANGTSLTVQLTVGPTVTRNPKSIVVLTGAEEAVLPNGLLIQ